MTPEEKKRFAGDASEWLASLPPTQHDWAEALLAAALDETGGDGPAALELAKRMHADDPDGTRD